MRNVALIVASLSIMLSVPRSAAADCGDRWDFLFEDSEDTYHVRAVIAS